MRTTSPEENWGTCGKDTVPLDARSWHCAIHLGFIQLEYHPQQISPPPLLPPLKDFEKL